MTAEHALNHYLERFPAGAAALYVVLVAVLVVATWMGVATIVEQRAAVAAASDLLAQIEGRRPSARVAEGAPNVSAPTGSPFLEGETVTVAGAALLQHVATAITRVGGNVVSSQVDLQGPQSKDGHIILIVSCEVDQASLQQLLYDLEAGMPFLFVDQLVAQAPVPTTVSDTGRMRVLLTVSGQWEGPR